MKLQIPNFSKPAAAFGTWVLYQLRPVPGDSALWPKFKLQLPSDTPVRAGVYRSYRLSWNAVELRMARSRARLDLDNDHPDLIIEVEMYLTLNRGRDWLLDPRGANMTEAKIDAELARIRGVRAAWIAQGRRPVGEEAAAKAARAKGRRAQREERVRHRRWLAGED